MSDRRRVVIVGGVAGGMSAATRLRRVDENAEIIVLERSGYVSFANCGLPYHLSGTIEERSALVLQTPQSLAARFGIDVRIKSEVVEIDRASKQVTVVDTVEGREYTLPYDYLVLSPGAGAVLPAQPGGERAIPMRDIEDLDRAMAWLYAKPTSAVVLGGGFIGIEVTENLIKRGMQVSLVQRGPQLLPMLDPELAIIVQQRMTSAGVSLHLGQTVAKFGKKTVELLDGTILAADLVFVASGVSPETALASSAGLELGPNGGILVDEFQRTSDSSIYAVGDVAEKVDAVTGETKLVSLAGLANRHGHAVANHIAGVDSVPATPALGTSIVSFDGLAAAALGMNEKTATKLGKKVRIVQTHPANHAAYYPGAQTMRLKMLVDPKTDFILGAQGVGGEGVDKRMDVIATAMFAGITASQLAQLELSYDPQHGSAKDPINMLGYVNRNIAEGLTRVAEWHEVSELVSAGTIVVDVRSTGEHKYGHIPGSLNIPVDTLRDHLADLAGRDVLVYCQVGQRGHTASRILSQHGINSTNLNGGYLTWKAGMNAKGTQQ